MKNLIRWLLSMSHSINWFDALTGMNSLLDRIALLVTALALLLASWAVFRIVQNGCFQS